MTQPTTHLDAHGNPMSGDPETIRQAGRIVVLEHGRIVEQGTHDELVEARGRYWELYRDWAAHAAA